MSLPDISHMRGLGEPHYFAFDVTKKDHIVVSHAIICASFVHSKDREIKLLDPKDDPRLPHFIRYLSKNTPDLKYIKSAIDKLTLELNKLEEGKDKLKAEIAALKI